MLIGNRERFAIQLTPVTPTWERRYRPELTAWAGLSLWVSGMNLCAHVREGESDVRDAFYVPLAPLADWLVRAYPALALEERAPLVPTTLGLHEMVKTWGARQPPPGIDEDTWFDTREAFWERHFLISGAEGARLPNLAFLRDEDDLVVCWREPPTLSGPSITMLHPQGCSWPAWTDAHAVIREFVITVRGWLRDAKAESIFPWSANDDEPLSFGGQLDAVMLFCAHSRAELADLFGVDPAEVTSKVGLTADATDPSVSPVCQVVRDLPPRPQRGVGDEIIETVDMSVSKGDAGLGPWTDGRDHARDAARASARPEEQGQFAAQALRNMLNINGRPIDSVDELLDRFCIEQRQGKTRTTSERAIVACAKGGRPVATLLPTRRTQTPWGRRFEQARALGHLLLDPQRDGAIGAASTPFAQETRRRRSGAFAAEILLPQDALAAASGGELDGAAEESAFRELLARYNVGARTAAHQLFNHGWLSSESVRDDLIEACAATASTGVG